MPKIWDLMPKETKTKVMAYRHYLEKTEGGKTMRKEGTKLVIEQEELNTVIAYEIKEYQFYNKNEMPEQKVVEVPACATGRDRNDKPYAVEIEVKQVANNENTLPPAPVADETLPKASGQLKVTATLDDYHCTACNGMHVPGSENYESHKGYEKPQPTESLEDELYYCTQCKRNHVPGSKIHRSHKKHMTRKA